MKSLDDFRKSNVSEGHVATSDFYLNNIVDPYTGKITLKKTRRSYMDFGHNKYPKYIGIPPEVGERDPQLHREELTEAKKSVADPPMMLVLKRQAIRYYPNNTKIALYYSDKLNQHFSVPYSDAGYGSPIQAESGILNRLTDEMSELYEALNDENKKRMLSKLFESEEDFKKIETFAYNWKHKC